MPPPGVRMGRPLLAVLAVALLLVPIRRTAGADAVRNECELGITLALMGRPAAAESLFTSMLSRSPHDPRALNNLGNLAMVGGEAKLALAFYERASWADSSDAGIVLNAATALLVLGEEESAATVAAEGVRGAGGARAAAGLLGLRYRESDEPKAAERAYLGKDEVIELLRASAGRIPADSARAAGIDTSATRGKKRPPVWRAAGPRAGATAEAATLVYWKR